MGVDAGGLRRIGVEEELLLVDEDSGRPVAIVDSIIQARAIAKSDDCPVLSSELKQEQVEVISPPRQSLDDLKREIMSGRRLADSTAQIFGARAAALATSALPVESHLTASDRFDAMRGVFGVTLREQLTCGLHVHVEVEDDEEGVAVLNRIRPWLPVLLALSSNSPFWNGQDTEFASYRYQAWCRWPSAGPYDLFESVDDYHCRVESLLRTGVLVDHAMVYFDARLSHHHPTVEVRVGDVCLEVEHTIALAALVRALVETASRDWKQGVAADAVPTEVLRLAMWRASRFGVTDTLVNPILGDECPAEVAVDALLAHVQPVLAAQGELEQVQRALQDMLTIGTGADYQRELFRLTRSHRAVVKEAIDRTHPAHNESMKPAMHG